MLGKNSRVISPGSLSGETLNEKDECGAECKNLGKDEFMPMKYRLQRQKAQNRRSFRLRNKTAPRSNERGGNGGLFKSDTIDNSEELKQIQSAMFRNENDSTTSSPSYISGPQSLLSSPQDRDCGNDTNGNINTAAIYECSNQKTALLLNSIENQTNQGNINKLNNNAEFPMRVISDLSLALNRRAVAEVGSELAPFENTLTKLPFADEDV